MSKPPFFLSASHWINKKDKPLKSGKNARKAVLIPLVLMQYGSIKEKLSSIKKIKPALATSITEMRKSAKELILNPQKGNRKIDNETLKKLENYARELGVSQIGYTKVNPDFIFDGFEILYDSAMIITMNMDKDAIKSSPSDASIYEIWRTYSSLGIIVNKLASFLREHGYNCHPSPAVGGDVSTVPVAQDAGIGVIGKNGLLITPEFGPSQRLAAVFIDVDNLPLKTIEQNEHLWIKDFCETCNNCVKHCPGGAIFMETKILEDGYPKYIEREKCAPHFSANCCTCITSCPFINGKYDKIKERFLSKNKK